MIWLRCDRMQAADTGVSDQRACSGLIRRTRDLNTARRSAFLGFSPEHAFCYCLQIAIALDVKQRRDRVRAHRGLDGPLMELVREKNVHGMDLVAGSAARSTACHLCSPARSAACVPPELGFP